MFANIGPQALHLKEFLEGLPLKLGSEIAKSPRQEIADFGSSKLYYYTAFNSKSNLTPVLIIPSLINRAYILDLLPEKSLIQYLLQHVGPVYLIEWGNPRDEERYVSLENLILNRMHYFVSKVLNHAQSKKVNLIGHCLGGTLSLIYSSLYSDIVNKLTLITTPVDFHKCQKLTKWVQESEFDCTTYLKAYGNMSGALLQATFQWLKPMLIYEKLFRFGKNWNNTEFKRQFFALEIWSQDFVTIYGKAYQEVIDLFFRQNLLLSGHLKIGGLKVNLKNLKCPILNMQAEDDHIVPLESGIKSIHIQKKLELTHFFQKGGHIGSLLNTKSQKNFWPQLAAWIH